MTATPPVVVFLAGLSLLVVAVDVVFLFPLHRQDRYRYHAPATEVEQSAGRLRRRITEHRLGLAGTSVPREQ